MTLSERLMNRDMRENIHRKNKLLGHQQKHLSDVDCTREEESGQLKQLEVSIREQK